MENTPRISTDFQLSPGASGPQEIVTVTTCFRALESALDSTVVRRWISALDGTGLEADSGDPVTLLEGESSPFSQAALEAFHSRALAELEVRKGVDYEIADLFAP